MKQRLIEFERNPRQSISCNCDDQQWASHRRNRSSRHKHVRLESEIKSTGLDTVYHSPIEHAFHNKIEMLKTSKLSVHVRIAVVTAWQLQ